MVDVNWPSWSIARWAAGIVDNYSDWPPSPLRNVSWWRHPMVCLNGTKVEPLDRIAHCQIQVASTGSDPNMGLLRLVEPNLPDALNMAWLPC